MENILVFDDSVSSNSKYVVMVDPIDGSSNVCWYKLVVAIILLSTTC